MANTKFILPSLQIYVPMILATEFVFSSGYFPGCFLCVVIILIIVLYCTFRIISLLSFYIHIFGQGSNSYFIFDFGLGVST
jgi:hypothetical protein